MSEQVFGSYLDNLVEDEGVRAQRLRSEQYSLRDGICNSCQDTSAGSKSASSGVTYAYCAKCITRANAACDSYATAARGLDKGPFVDIPIAVKVEPVKTAPPKKGRGR